MGELFDPNTLSVCNGYDISQIHLSLTVVATYLAKGCKEEFLLRQVDAGIDFSNASFCFGGILFFDNGRHHALIVGKDPAITKRLIKQGGHQCQ